MSGNAITEALTGLREAGRALRAEPPRRTLAALETLLDAWSDPKSPVLRDLPRELAATTGFHEATVREGLAQGLAPFRGDALRNLRKHELGTAADTAASWDTSPRGFDATAVVLAGAIPMPTLVSMVAPLALGSPVLVKTARHDPITARRVASTLREIDAKVGDCVRVATFPHGDVAALEALVQADCIVANGSNETLAALAPRIAPWRRWIPYGHRISLAVLGPAAASAERVASVAERLARDIALWDQLGCLSPQAVFVVDADPRASERVAESLAGALEEAGNRWPRGRVEPAAAALAAHERAEAELREAAGHPVRVYAGELGCWTVIREEDARVRPAPAHRFVRVHALSEPAQLEGKLCRLSHRLAGVALEGFGGATAELVATCGRLGASRICPVGQIQAPPLHWPRDNRPVLIPIARLLETGTSPREQS